MKVDHLEAIERVPLAIDYRRLYRARVVIAIADRKTSPTPIEFSLELSPFGGYEITVQFLDGAEYPLIPALKLVKEHIKTLDRTGDLP